MIKIDNLIYDDIWSPENDGIIFNWMVYFMDNPSLNG